MVTFDKSIVRNAILLVVILLFIGRCIRYNYTSSSIRSMNIGKNIENFNTVALLAMRNWVKFAIQKFKAKILMVFSDIIAWEIAMKRFCQQFSSLYCSSFVCTNGLISPYCAEAEWSAKIKCLNLDRIPSYAHIFWTEMTSLNPNSSILMHSIKLLLREVRMSLLNGWIEQREAGKG